MITITDYANAIGRNKETVHSTIRRMGDKMEGHLSYSYVQNRRGRNLILDEKAVDMLDEFYGLDKPGVHNSIPVHAAKPENKVKKTTPSYKRKYDEVSKKLLVALEKQNTLLLKLDSTNDELTKVRGDLANTSQKLFEANNKIEALHQRNVWDRIRNK